MSEPGAGPRHAAPEPPDITIEVPAEPDAGLSDATRRELAEAGSVDPVLLTDSARELAPSGYDAQSDLALASSEPDPADVATPFAGSVVPAERPAGYDVDRDAGR